jgi:hypothetical protein
VVKIILLNYPKGIVLPVSLEIKADGIYINWLLAEPQNQICVGLAQPGKNCLAPKIKVFRVV